MPVTVVGAGLAGSECAWQLARRGHRVRLREMRPAVGTAAHQTGKCAELVCSNSFRSDNPLNAIGLLKREMEALDSLIIQSARAAAVPAGDALAMDRTVFADRVTEAIQSRPEIELVRDEVRRIPPEGFVVLATGPLTSAALDAEIGALLGTEDLYFYDSIAPVVVASSLDFSKMYAMSRYGKGEGEDYWNCPMTQGAVRDLHRGSPRRRDGPDQGLREGRLLRGLPPDRGHGRARRRDPPARAVETDGPSGSAHRAPSLRGRAAAAGRSGQGALQHRRLPDEAEDPRAAADLPKDPGPGERRLRSLRDAPQEHVHQGARAPGSLLEDAPRAANLLRRADHGSRGIRRERRDGPDRRADDRAAPGGARAGSRALHERDRVSRAALLGAPGGQALRADERDLRPDGGHVPLADPRQGRPAEDDGRASARRDRATGNRRPLRK